MAHSHDPNQGIHSTLCRAGCGFFGSPNTEGFCSKCFKEHMKPREDLATAVSPMQDTVLGATKPILTANKPVLGGGANPPALDACPQHKLDLIEDDVIDNEAPKSANEKGASRLLTELTPESQKKKRFRCDICNKKVGLTGFTCRCKRLFCSEHQYPDEHQCEIDYKQLGRDQLKKANPLVVAEKIKKL